MSNFYTRVPESEQKSSLSQPKMVLVINESSVIILDMSQSSHMIRR